MLQVRREKIEQLLKESFRPVNKLITEIQICLVFWVLGRSSRLFTPTVNRRIVFAIRSVKHSDMLIL